MIIQYHSNRFSANEPNSYFFAIILHILSIQQPIFAPHMMAHNSIYAHRIDKIDTDNHLSNHAPPHCQLFGVSHSPKAYNTAPATALRTSEKKNRLSCINLTLFRSIHTQSHYATEPHNVRTIGGPATCGHNESTMPFDVFAVDRDFYVARA